MSKTIAVTCHPGQPILIGIDVGWSVKRRTCAVALQGVRLDRTATVYYRNAGDESKSICVSLFTLKALTGFLPELLLVLQDRVQQGVLVVDGPLGCNGPPNQNRHVDKACGIDGFRHRAQPSPVEGNSGRTYVEATYSIIEPFMQAAGGARPWLKGPLPNNRLVIAETHPTVAMALMLTPQNPSFLPTRKRAMSIGDWVVRAKSDWYWRLGVNKKVARILGERRLSDEFNHERVAGLFCLAMAAQLCSRSADGSSAIAIGSTDGVYVVPQGLGLGWEADVRRVGVAWGQPTFGQTVIAVPPPEETISLPDLASTREGDDMSDEHGKGADASDLILDDNGSVWEKRNDWLVGFESNVVVKALDGNGEEITLTRAKSATQWKANPKSLKLAKARGFVGRHLSRKSAIAIPVQIL